MDRANLRPSQSHGPVIYETIVSEEPMPLGVWNEARRILCWWMIQEYRRRHNEPNIQIATVQHVGH